MKTLLSLFLFVITFTATFAQNNYPKDYFRSPMDIPLQLSGNFGELRTNHFHAGLDFRTQQKEGLNIYAAAEGYVSRIKISTYGYGKAIYITHPNGFTTLYGHLQKGSPRLEKFIKEQQYKEKAYEIEVFLKPDELVVKKGELIAFSGNTGGSQGPHLHFEVRDSKSEKAINPIHFYSDILHDRKRPAVVNVVAYPLNDSAVVNRSKNPVLLDLKTLSDGSYVAERVLANGPIGFGVNTYDSDNSSSFKNGTYKVEAFSNGSLSFGYTFDTFAFDESRYLNALMDYSRYKRTRQKVQKLFMKQPYPLSIIRTNDKNGIVDVSPNLTQNYRIELTDFSNNRSTITIPVEYSPLPATDESDIKITPFYLTASKDHNFEKDNFSVFIPANTFYEDFHLQFDVKDNVLTLHNDSTPAHTNVTISVVDTTLTEEQREKSFIASVNGKRLGYNSTKRKGNTFTTYTKNLGDFTIAQDTIAPKISISKSIEGKWITSQKSLDFTISDNLSGLKEYNGYLNGEWVLFEYEHKLRRISYDFDDDKTVDGRNELKIVVSDNVGNSAIFETHFFRSKK
ncbi:MAG: M23 family metallopeptidase [Flavobacterium sp.]|nr:M23 family metallopeptidase [Flavobacterium sp.]